MYGVTRRSQLGLGQSSVVGAISSFGRTLATDQIKGVYFRSQVSPDIELDPSQMSGERPRTLSEGGISELFLRVAKPAMYVDTTMGAVRVAPWGEPKLNLFPVILAGTLIGGALVAGLIARGLR
jgi:hypothetical protein